MVMNFSTKHKVIWWAPERCATKLVADIFSHYNFEYKNNVNSVAKELTAPYHSHGIFVPEEFNDFKLICSIRNPYDRVLSLFTNFTSIGSQIVYTKIQCVLLSNLSFITQAIQNFINSLIVSSPTIPKVRN